MSPSDDEEPFGETVTMVDEDLPPSASTKQPKKSKDKGKKKAVEPKTTSAPSTPQPAVTTASGNPQSLAEIEAAWQSELEQYNAGTLDLAYGSDDSVSSAEDEQEPMAPTPPNVPPPGVSAPAIPPPAPTTREAERMVIDVSDSPPTAASVPLPKRKHASPSPAKPPAKRPNTTGDHVPSDVVPREPPSSSDAAAVVNTGEGTTPNPALRRWQINVDRLLLAMSADEVEEFLFSTEALFRDQGTQGLEVVSNAVRSRAAAMSDHERHVFILQSPPGRGLLKVQFHF
ncbi:hypothetical protein CONPUDRAFT_70766 [Coniophora puteana RWD-64-598 SS2]|uniref:Uncharacterized protein n=1 Tax=Coniophora puteana (strain RWD-64-598) TaxID=741705 RepID=A0A5M3MZ03_CONPW|nr:uncharacterized protein CONPUDRAFT_70766 [Coniophora puteana RWD-64-598 SS2]EIW83831.1 hypothetical protein CONPUDRAFT_70766 [Coniophora puteana RWD-64-598 SS2]